jgi:hypothetical protein
VGSKMLQSSGGCSVAERLETINGGGTSALHSSAMEVPTMTGVGRGFSGRRRQTTSLDKRAHHAREKADSDGRDEREAPCQQRAQRALAQDRPLVRCVLGPAGGGGGGRDDANVQKVIGVRQVAPQLRQRRPHRQVGQARHAPRDAAELGPDR